MKKIFITIVLLAITITNSSAQATLSINNATGNQGSAVSIAVNATGITDMQGFQFTIGYDNTKLTYVNCTNWSGGTIASGVQITDLPAQGKITFVYNDVSINILSGLFFNLNFTIQQPATGSSAIGWIDVPTNRELSNSVPDIIFADYVDGSITINTLGTEEYDFSDYSSYPNPVNDILNIENTVGEKIKQINVYNSLGQVVYRVSDIASVNKFSINVAHLQSGIYLAEILSENGRVVKKIVKN